MLQVGADSQIMKTKFSFLLFLILNCFIFIESLNSTAQPSKRPPWVRAKSLITDLLANYSKIVRPRNDQSEAVNVYFDIKIKQLIRVDVKTQQVVLLICLWQAWIDDNLTWDPDYYLGRFVRLNPNDIWIPDILFINSIQDFEHLKEITILPVRVNWKGSVLWQLPLLRTTRCQMDVRFFPYDIQTCYLDLSSFRMFGHQINLEFIETDESPKHVLEQALKEVLEHPEWELINVAKERVSAVFGSIEVPKLRFEYSFRRRAMYFEYTMIFPTIMISLMAFFAFNLPNGCGEKISFSITVFLALVLNLCIMGGFIPNSNAHFPLMGEFLFLGICIVAASVIQSVLVLIMHHSAEAPVRAPRLLRTVVLKFLTKITLTSTLGIEMEKQILEDEKMKLQNGVTETLPASTPSNSSTSKEPAIDLQQTEFCVKIGKLWSMLVGKIEFSASHWATVMQQREMNDQIKLEWEVIAQVFDRLLMLFFSLICIGCFVIFRIKIFNGYSEAISRFPKLDEPEPEDYEEYYYYYY